MHAVSPTLCVCARECTRNASQEANNNNNEKKEQKQNRTSQRDQLTIAQMRP